MRRVVRTLESDPDPLVITLLRPLVANTLAEYYELFLRQSKLAGVGVAVTPEQIMEAENSTKEYALAALREIVACWDNGQKVRDLAQTLGLRGGRRRHRRRTARTVGVEKKLAGAVVAAALNGTVRISAIAKDLEIDERRIRDAWRKWREVEMSNLQALAERSVYRAEFRETIARLQKLKVGAK